MAAPAAPARGRAVAVLVVAVMLVVLLLGVVAYLVVHALNGNARTSAPGSPTPTASPVDGAPTGSVSVQAQQDAVAAQPMLQLPQSAAKPQALVRETAGPPIRIPAPSHKVIPGGPPVATGFPQTPEGALAQLAAIDEAALSTTDLGRVDEVYRWAAAPGAVPETQWTPFHGISRLITALSDPAKVQQTQATFQVVQGQIKGTVGPDFVVACVLGEFDATLTTTQRAGVGDCQRMIWRDNRWWIGPGTQPVFAPSAWPGSADAVRAGWKEVKHA